MTSISLPLCAVIVAFNPDDKFIERLIRISNNCDFIIIIDNSLIPWSLTDNNRSELFDKVHLISNHKNLGIGKALNQGIQCAHEMGYKQVITFDQDTIISDNLRDSLNMIITELGDTLAIIGCNYWNTNKNKLRHRCENSEEHVSRCKTVITSGMLLTKQVIDKIGFFREGFFIDSVDHEYCLRARQAGINVYHSCGPLMHHSIGLKPSTAFNPVLAFNHVPVRKYYMTRNILVTIAEYWKTEPLWGGKQILRLMVELLSIILFEAQKKAKLKATWLGIKDAFQHKMGKIDDSYLLGMDGSEN